MLFSLIKITQKSENPFYHEYKLITIQLNYHLHLKLLSEISYQFLLIILLK